MPVDDDTEVEIPAVTSAPPERSIRNINVNRSRPSDRREVPPVGSGMPRPSKSYSTVWLWIIAFVLLVVVGFLSIFLFRTTTVTVTPRTHTIVLEQGRSITAYPLSAAATGTLAYTIQTFDEEASDVVASQGTQRAERKASGSVTIVNEFSTDPVKLVKTTRFSTPDGLVFRAPEDISVPGMKGTTPGTITVTLVADAVGTKYNIGPVSRFSLPGLKGGAMYDKVYAKSSTAFSGGFSGDEPAVADAVKSSTIAALRTRLQDKVLANMKAQASVGTMFPSLAYVVFEDVPPTPEGTGQVRLSQKIHVQVPVFATQTFNKLLASTVSTDVENVSLTLIPKDGYTANIQSTTSTSYGSTPVTFTLSGNAQIVWDVDTAALASALVGKDQSAFQTVVNGFPSVQEARARVEPFWSKTFPSDPKKIKIIVTDPGASSNP